jgi:hypothetical protein
MGGASQSVINGSDPACVPCAGNCARAGVSGSASSSALGESGVIAASAVGGVAGGALILAVAVYCWRATSARAAAAATLTQKPPKSAAV